MDGSINTLGESVMKIYNIMFSPVERIHFEWEEKPPKNVIFHFTKSNKQRLDFQIFRWSFQKISIKFVGEVYLLNFFLEYPKNISKLQFKRLTRELV